MDQTKSFKKYIPESGPEYKFEPPIEIWTWRLFSSRYENWAHAYLS